jgi:hypothetical protein
MNNYNQMAQPWSQVAPTARNLPVNPDHPFYYKHWPANWEFAYIDMKKGKKTIQSPVYLPSIDMERVVPGVNGVHQINGELGDPSSRLGKLRQQGFVILDPTEHDYMRVYPARYGGKRHAPKWQSFRVLAGQVIAEFDKIAFNQWRINLISSGIINPPDPHFMELMIISYSKLSDRLIPSQHLPEIKKKLDAEYKKQSDMKQAMIDISEQGAKYYEGLLNVD